jgi:hypothetical protein
MLWCVVRLRNEGCQCQHLAPRMDDRFATCNLPPEQSRHLNMCVPCHFVCIRERQIRESKIERSLRLHLLIPIRGWSSSTYLTAAKLNKLTSALRVWTPPSSESKLKGKVQRAIGCTLAELETKSWEKKVFTGFRLTSNVDFVRSIIVKCDLKQP